VPYEINTVREQQMSSNKKSMRLLVWRVEPHAGISKLKIVFLEPAISTLGGLRVIHYASGANRVEKREEEDKR